MKKLLTLLLALVAIAVHATDYQLWINGTQVTSANASNLSVINSVTGTVTYNASTNTLTLNNATITAATASNIENRIDGLTINVVGTNTLGVLSGNNASMFLVGQGITITGTGSLHCEANAIGLQLYYNTSLTITGGVQAKFIGSSAGIYGNQTSAYPTQMVISGANTKVTANGTDVCCIYNIPTTLNDGLVITQPEGAHFNSSGTVVDANGNWVKGQDVVISKDSYGPYAVYDASTTTLTFAYGYKPEGAYSLNTGTNQPAWYTDGTRSNVTKVVFDPSFADARPTSTFYWFRFMTKLSEIIGLNYLNTSMVTNMQDMFAYCYALTNVDVSAFNTNNVTNMQQMFSACKKLTCLDLRNFNTGKVTNMNYMFWSCEDLATIVVGDDWSTAAVTSSENMFYGCTNIVGSKGTTYDPNHIDKEYARIDGGTSSPGYFSEPIMPYAVYDASTTTLTFAYGPKPEGAYSLNTGTSYPAWYSDGTCSNVTKVFFNPTFADVRPTTTYYWFAGMTNLTSVLGLNNFNTSEVTNMSYMFYACQSLTDLDLTSFNTAKVTGMYGMFCACYGLKNLNVSSFNTANVTDMYHMFTACRQLTTLDLSSFNTAKVTDMEEMFYNSTNLVTIKVGNDWSTAAVTSSNNMFKGCTNIKGGAGTTYDANHVNKAYAHIDGGTSNPGYLSAGEYNLWINGTQVTATNAGNLSVIEGVSGTVKYNAGTKTLTLNNATITSTESNGECIQSEIDGLTIALVGNNTLTADQNSSSPIIELKTTTITGPGSLKATGGDTGIKFHAGCSLTIDDVPNLTISSSKYGIYASGTNGSRLTMKGENTVVNVNVTGTSIMRSAIRNMGEFVLEDGLEIVEPAGGYFSDNKLRDADGNIAKQALIGKPAPYAVYDATTTTLTFAYGPKPEGAYSLNKGTSYPAWYTDGTNANVTKVVFDPSFADARPTITHFWFANMKQLTEITGLSYLNTSEVTTMSYMFEFCSKLSTLDLTSFNTSKVKSMVMMFYGCWGLTDLNVSSFNTSEVTTMYYMFCSCQRLTSLDLTSFNTSKVSNMANMFGDCNDLVTIYVGDNWSTTAVTNSTDMFHYCTDIVGSKGTTYDADHIDKEYAHIDGGTSNPGYLSERSGLRGDINGDGKVDVSDVNIIINIMLGKAQASQYPGNADLNDDNHVDVSDVNAVINIMLGKQ